MALPIPGNASLSLANTETLNNRSQAAQSGGGGGEGYRGSIFQNFASGASSLDAAATASTGIPGYVWAVIVGGVGLLVFLIMRRK
jgi:hypothetical protein